MRDADTRWCVPAWRVPAKRHVAVAAALARPNVNQLALAVDIVDLQMAQFGATHPRRVKRHEHRPVQQVTGGIDELAHFLLTQHNRKAAYRLGKGNMLQHVVTFERLHEEEAQCGDPLHNGSGAELLLLEKIALKSPDVIWAQLIRRTVKVFGELPDCQQVRPYGSLRVITTLEFLQHHFA